MSLKKEVIRKMVEYGTYSTIDCPNGSAKVKEEALNFLTEKFLEIGGDVRVERNPHDFGSYPSFEIDYPEHLENIDNDDYSEENRKYLEEKDKWIERANEIEEEYRQKFEKYL